jgi:hypothetical protein
VSHTEQALAGLADPEAFRRAGWLPPDEAKALLAEAATRREAWEQAEERVARALYELAMRERGFPIASWDGPPTPQRTPFRGDWRSQWREAARAAIASSAQETTPAKETT